MQMFLRAILLRQANVRSVPEAEVNLGILKVC